MESNKKQALQDRGALPREEGDAIREFQAMREENFLSSWLREDGKSKMKEDKEVREGVGKVKESGRKKNMKRLSRGNVRTPFRMRPLTFSAKVKFRSAIRAMLTLTVSRERWSIALVSNDIYVHPSFAVEVVGVGEMSDSGCEFGSECGSVAVSGVPVVPEVVETTPSVVTVMCEGVPSDSEWDLC